MKVSFDNVHFYEVKLKVSLENVYFYDVKLSVLLLQEEVEKRRGGGEGAEMCTFTR